MTVLLFCPFQQVRIGSINGFYVQELWSTAEDLTGHVPWPSRIILTTILCYYLFVRDTPNPESHGGEDLDGTLDNADQKSSWNLPSTVPKKSVFRRSWFGIQAGDYLDRGNGNRGLRDKLQAYLKSQGEVANDYPFAYLVTAPRFLGYSFNPVSFWYLYNEEKQLRAMILEVNNTFDERRMYFLKDTIMKDFDESWTVIEHPRSKFKDTWPKDFHVSPFNSRKGSYALSAQDPFSAHLNDTCKLIARVFSDQPSIDPTTLGAWARLRFIASWWWVGFVTFPRIVREAGNLFFRRKLHVWYRPEVSKESIGRHATEDEAIIERTFRCFLCSLVTHSSLDHSIKYISPIPSSTTAEIFTPKHTTSPEEPSSQPQQSIEFRITTPLFYARLARYTHISEFLSTEILKDDNDDGNRTFYVSHPRPFLRLFEESERKTNSLDDQRASTTTTTTPHKSPLSWRFLHWLRSRRRRRRRQSFGPQNCPSPSSSSSSSGQMTDIRHLLGFSQLDRFAMRHECSSHEAARYRRTATKMLLSDIVAFGHPEMLDAVGYVTRVMLSYVFVWGVRVIWEWWDRRQRRGRGTWVHYCGDESWSEWETW
ncbi:MAG: hypothetical protein Q9197_002628 [Variospora fuerteventurae]